MIKSLLLLSFITFNLSLVAQDAKGAQPKEPFTYGLAYSYDQCLVLKDYLELLGIRNGHTIAGVGAADGYTLGAFSVVLDSSTIYIQDINKRYLNEESFANLTEYYDRIRSSEQTNHLHYVIGSKKKTNLPERAFDVVYIKNSYHEFKNKGAMLRDISTLLKPNGRIIITDEFTNDKEGRVIVGCNHDALHYDELHKAMKKVDLYPIKMLTLKDSWWNTIIYSFNEEKSKLEFSDVNSKTKLDSIVGQIANLGNKYFVRSARNFDKVEKDLLKYKGEIEESNNLHYIEIWLNKLSNYWLEKKKHNTALKIALINMAYNPDNAGHYVEIGGIFEAKKEYSKALHYYTIAEKLDANSVSIGYLGGKSKVELLKEKMN